MPDLGTDIMNPSKIGFSRAPGINSTDLRRPSTNNLVLLITRLHRLTSVKRKDNCAEPIPKRHQFGLRCRTYHYSTRISTRFPFDYDQLRRVLGPTNPQLIISAEEPLPIRRQGFSPCFAATTNGILIRERSTIPYNIASAHTRRLATTSIIEIELFSIGD